MKLLLFSDVHANEPACRRLVERAAEADVLVGAGDFGRQRRQIGVPIEILCTVDQPAVLVPGNAESVEELQVACRIWPSAEVLHGTGTVVQGLSFWGLGGGVPVTPFGSWSYDFTEDEARKLLAGCPTGGVLVTHSPPHGVVDEDRGGEHQGSQAVCETVRAKKPRLVVCGHIHDSAGRSGKLGSSTVWNAGPAGVLMELG